MLMIARRLFPFLQLTSLECLHSFVAGMTAFPYCGIFPRRERCPGALPLQQGMALFSVAVIIGTDLLYLAPQSIKQGRQEFIIPHRFKADFGGNDGVGLRIDRQVNLAPDSLLLLAMLAHLPFALTVDLQPGGIKHQMSQRSLARQTTLNVDLLGEFADATLAR